GVGCRSRRRVYECSSWPRGPPGKGRLLCKHMLAHTFASRGQAVSTAVRRPSAWWYHYLYLWRYRTMISLNLEEDIRPLSEFRADAAAMIQKIRETGRALVLTQRGHSSAVVLAIREYQQLLDELELLRDLQTAARQIEDGLGVPQEEARKQA